MPRSLKKSPFVAYHLLKKINKLNKAGNKKDTITTWSRSSTIYLVWLDLQLQSIMESNMSQSLFLTNSLVINWENLFQHELSGLILKLIGKQNVK